MAPLLLHANETLTTERLIRRALLRVPAPPCSCAGHPTHVSSDAPAKGIVVRDGDTVWSGSTPPLGARHPSCRGQGGPDIPLRSFAHGPL
jgi:hypothetical protein